MSGRDNRSTAAMLGLRSQRHFGQTPLAGLHAQSLESQRKEHNHKL